MMCPECGVKLRVYYGEAKSGTEYKRYMRCMECYATYQSMEIMAADGSDALTGQEKANGRLVDANKALKCESKALREKNRRLHIEIKAMREREKQRKAELKDMRRDMVRLEEDSAFLHAMEKAGKVRNFNPWR